MPACWNFKQRIYEPEIMDSCSVPEQEMREGLEFLRKTNLYFGGNKIILNYLNQFSKSWDRGETVRILDVGCGLGDISLAIAMWAKKNHFTVKITGLDIIPQIAHLAQVYTAHESTIEIKIGDIFSENIAPESYDYVIASLFLHHLDNAHLNLALKKFHQIAKRGLILSDLYRSATSYWAVFLSTKILGNKMAQHDGPLSVQRALTLQELQTLAQNTGLFYLKAKKEPFFRLSLAGEKR